MTPVVIGAVIEIVFVALAVMAIVRIQRHYKRRRHAVPEFWMALEEGLSTQIGTVGARLVIGEPKIFFALASWLLRRRRRLPPRAFAYASASQIGMVTGVVLCLVVLEGSLSAVVLPWPGLKVVLVLVSIYAAAWIVGIYASLHAYPHLLTDQGLLVRYGVLGDAWIAWRDVADISIDKSTSPGGQDGLFVEDDTAIFAVGGKTSVAIRRRTPGTVSGFLRQSAGIKTIRITADEPDAFVRAVLAARADHPPTRTNSATEH